MSPKVSYAPWSLLHGLFSQKKGLSFTGVNNTVQGIPDDGGGDHTAYTMFWPWHTWDSNDGKGDVFTIEHVDLTILIVDLINKGFNHRKHRA